MFEDACMSSRAKLALYVGERLSTISVKRVFLLK